MARSDVVVRPVGAEEADLVGALVAQLRAEDQLPPRADDVGDTTRGTAVGDLARIAQALARPDVRVLVAELAGVPVGLLVLRRDELLPLSRRSAVHVDEIVVVRSCRRRGIGRALLAAAARAAEAEGLEQVVVAAPPSGREANRFLARLGFAPLVVQRAASVTTLRRHLAGEALRRGRPGEGARRAAVEQVLVRRRRERLTGA